MSKAHMSIPVSQAIGDIMNQAASQNPAASQPVSIGFFKIQNPASSHMDTKMSDLYAVQIIPDMLAEYSEPIRVISESFSDAFAEALDDLLLLLEVFYQVRLSRPKDAVFTPSLGSDEVSRSSLI